MEKNSRPEGATPSSGRALPEAEEREGRGAREFLLRECKRCKHSLRKAPKVKESKEN